MAFFCSKDIKALLFMRSCAGVGFFPVFVALLLIGGLSWPAAGAPLSEQDKTCLACHASKGLEKKLRSGESLSLHIKTKTFANSVHGGMGCVACHSAIDLNSHPSTVQKIESSRAFSVAQVEVCKPCHDDKFKQYETSIHARLVREGNPIAPVCTDCHNPHAVRPNAARQSLAEIPCQKCHSSIFDAYAASVHGRSRSQSDQSTAPICSDCHHAHNITAASTSDQPKHACEGCHQNLLRKHQEWLPNADTHLQVISCPACHVPNAKRRVDLRLFDNGSQQRVTEKEGLPQFETRAHAADEKGQGLDAPALQNLIKQFNAKGVKSNTTLRGRLEVSDEVEIHQLTTKDKAIRDCATCHRAGANVFQSVTVSIVGPDGRPVRYDAQKDVLNSVTSVDSLRGFYAIGGTRIKLLDWLLLLVVLGGISIPIGHQTLRWLFQRHAAKVRKENIARGASGANPAAPDDKPDGGTSA